MPPEPRRPVPPDPRRADGPRQGPPNPNRGNQRSAEPMARHPETGELYTAAMCEREIVRITQAMEEMVPEMVEAAEERARAEHAYKVKFAKNRLWKKAQEGNGPGGRTTDAEAEDHATIECDKEMLDRLVTAAKWEVFEEKSRLMRASLDSLRTISANIRSQT